MLATFVLICKMTFNLAFGLREGSDVRVGFKEKEKCDENLLCVTKCRNFKIRKLLFFFILNTLPFRLPNFACVTLN